MEEIIITTTNSVEGHPIKKYLGLVSYRAWCITKTHLVGNMSNKFVENYREFIKRAEDGLKEEAALVGANAVVGVKFHLDVSLAVTLLITGTAVIVE